MNIAGPLLLLAGISGAAEPPVSYARDVRPIFVQHCQGCHQPAKARGGYDITSAAGMLAAGNSGKAAIVPGKAAESHLLELIQVKDGQAEMPAGRPPLKEAEIDVIRRWIAAGAVSDISESGRRTGFNADHPPPYPAPPVISSLAISPDGGLLAITGYHEVLLRSADGLEERGRLIGLSERVQSLAFSPDGSLLAAAGGAPGRFGELQIWRVDQQELKLSATIGTDTLYGVSWNPDGTLLAVGCPDNTVRVVEAASGRQVFQMGTHTDWVLGTTFSRDGSHLVSVSRDMSAKLTNVAEQRFIDNITSITPGTLRGGLMAVDRRPLQGQRLQKLPKDTPNAKPQLYDELLFAGSDGTPRIYKMHREAKREISDDSNHVKTFDALPGRVSSIRFDPSGERFAAAASNDRLGEVRIVRIEDGKTIRCESVSGPAYAVAWSPCGTRVVSGGFDGVVWLHEAATGKLIRGVSVIPRSP